MNERTKVDKWQAERLRESLNNLGFERFDNNGIETYISVGYIAILEPDNGKWWYTIKNNDLTKDSYKQIL